MFTATKITKALAALYVAQAAVGFTVGMVTTWVKYFNPAPWVGLFHHFFG